MKCVEPGFMTLLERALNCRSTLNPSLYIYYITNLGSWQLPRHIIRTIIPFPQMKGAMVAVALSLIHRISCDWYQHHFIVFVKYTTKQASCAYTSHAESRGNQWRGCWPLAIVKGPCRQTSSA